MTTSDILTYIADDKTCVSVYKGFVTDFASVPSYLDGILPSFGPWARAAIIHDYLYYTRGMYSRLTRKRCDAIFREALKACGVSAWRRNAMWAAVRLGGAGGWGG